MSFIAALLPAKWKLDATHLRLASGGAWIALGHLLAACGLIIGTRLLSELLAPSVFGEVALVNAALALGQGILYYPLGQAVQRYLPSMAGAHGETAFRALLTRQYSVRFAYAAVLCLPLAWFFSFFIDVSAPVWLLAVVGLATEGVRTRELVIANGYSRQVSYSSLLALDGGLRFLGGAAGAWIWQPTVESVLCGQLLVGVLVLSCYCALARPKPESIKKQTIHPEQSSAMRDFARPLVISPVLSWMTGLAGRYVVSSSLGLAAAGVYSAAYALASRPFVLVGAVTESTFRQAYYAAVATHDGQRAARVLGVWVGLNVIIGAVGVALIYVWQDAITALLLAPAYSAAAALMPWIAAGYMLLIFAQVLERVAFAKGSTRGVVAVQLTTAILSVVGVLAGAIVGGLVGSAIAVPLYFCVQAVLMLGVATAKR